MTLTALVLFVLTFLAGALVFRLHTLQKQIFDPLLVFAGAYLFGITIIHILPELYIQHSVISHISLWVMAGFFLQLILEYFSRGIEHGHLHVHEDEPHSWTWLSVCLALIIHAFLEGTLLAHPDTIHSGHGDNSYALLIGILLHKLPAAFALMSVVLAQLKSKRLAWIILTAFSLASPLGLLISDGLHAHHLISAKVFVILFAVVAGSFLHISTTIFFESRPGHQLNIKKLIISVLGALLAVLSEWLL